MTERFPHIIVAPVVLPLMTAALLLLLGQKRKRAKSIANIGAALAGLLVALEILRGADAGGSSGAAGVYLMSNWEAPFGIVLVADRLSALMLVLVGVVSLCAALYAEAAWGRAGAYFHALFQIQLMGLNGAFLTGDLFNLFVFFEVMLAASYGLHLHGSGWPRVRSGLHYIAVNLLASSLFLVGLAVLYGVMGTLSMADIAEKLALVPARDRGLLHAGAAVLAVAFLIKAAIWPLNAWLVPAYSATSAPVAALFALMTKVGIYVLLRLWTLFFSAGASAQFGGTVLLYAGLATIAFGAIGLMASMSLGRIAGFSVIVSSGTLLASLGTGTPAVTSAALFYMLSATLAVSALFLLVELVERIGSDGQRRVPDLDVEPGEDTNLDDEEAPLVARAFPVSIALLGLAFMVCAMLVAGLPPLSGFVAKASLLTALLSPRGDGHASAGAPIPPAAWMLFGLLLLSGLAATISLARAGIRYFWSSGGRLPPRLKAVEAASVLGLILCCILLTLCAEPVLRTTSATAAGLHSPKAYIEAVLSMRPRPGPTRSVIEEEEAP
ncbi:monovalent cation/H+ antiporter subunit D [Sorangium sp. So ce362]|uniref:monovalent cation/H+ antiporter subunit D n=1 Tax=Sorangium sp. So ce362 TaxID=3133303 RepID=UPI003F6007EE